MPISVDTRSTKAVLDQLERNTNPLGLATYMGTIAAPYFSRRARDRFKTGGDNASGSWAALTEATKEIRQNLGYSSGARKGEINVRSGRMQDWLVRPNIVLAEDAAGTTLTWPGPEDRKMVERLAQAAGRRRGPARWVIAYDAGDVAYLLRTMESFAMTGKARG